MTTDRPTPRRRFPLGLTIATAIALAILVALGAWQVKRLAWKEALLARVAALQAARPVPLDPVLRRIASGGSGDFTRVAAVCPAPTPGATAHLYAVRDGEPGWRLISACPTPGSAYGSVLVDWGFTAGSEPAQPPEAAGGPVELVGVLRVPDPPTFVTPSPDQAHRRWWSRDVSAMARVLGAPHPAPLMLLAETQGVKGWSALVPSPLPSEIPNRHLEYALTWFGLAGALACVYAASLWKWWKD